MDITVTPNKLSGAVAAIPSKSQTHRLLICASFADAPTTIVCGDVNRDIEATVDCLRALGATIRRTDFGYVVHPIVSLPHTAFLPCAESGSTLRFMLPIVGALGIDGTFHMEGRLSQRPLSPLWEVMEEKGCCLSRPTTDTIRCRGQLQAGEYVISGGISSQFITGLLLALSLLKEKSTLQIVGKIESAPYIRITKEVMALFGVSSRELGGKLFHSPGQVTVEGDWSNAAFYLTANTLGSQVTVSNLNPSSFQGDRAVVELLPLFQTENPVISAADTPDLVPILAVAAVANHGAVFTDIQRLRLKESDRVLSVVNMLNALGGRAVDNGETLTVFPSTLIGGTVDSCNDHRIAMAAAIAATVCREKVTILGAESVKKSYPNFWADYRRLGGIYEQYIR